MKKYKLKENGSVFILEEPKCCNSDHKVIFLGGKCECGFCKIKLKSENNSRDYILSKDEFEALEEVEDRVEVRFTYEGHPTISDHYQLKVRNKCSEFRLWTEQEREDIEKFLNVGMFDGLDTLIAGYISSRTNYIKFSSWLKEKGYDK